VLNHLISKEITYDNTIQKDWEVFKHSNKEDKETYVSNIEQIIMNTYFDKDSDTNDTLKKFAVVKGKFVDG